jgi:prolyl oligopeptidase
MAGLGGALLAFAVAGTANHALVAQQASTEQPDKYTWLEDVHGAKSMDWVKAEDARTAAVLEKNSQFGTLEK